MKVLILSDLHLGHAASRAGPMLDGISTLARNYDRVILNGDTLDRYEQPGCEPNSEQLLRDVMDACRSRSGPPEIIAGNHDPAISTLHWVYLPHSATLVFHGDCIADCTHPSKEPDRVLARALAAHWQKIGERPRKFLDLVGVYRQVQGETLRAHPLTREPRSVLHYLVSAVCPPQRPLHVLHYWWQAPARVARLAGTFGRPVRQVIVGHSHRPGRWLVNGMTVFNTGGFMPLTTPYAVRVEGQQVTMHRVAALLRTPRTVFAPLAAISADERA